MMNGPQGMGGMGVSQGMGALPMQSVKLFKNPNPALGGTQWVKPGFGPMLAFYNAVNKTPEHAVGKYVIPWDHKNFDYVYPACPNKVFKGRTTLINLKSVGFLTNFFIIFFRQKFC